MRHEIHQRKSDSVYEIEVRSLASIDFSNIATDYGWLGIEPDDEIRLFVFKPTFEDGRFYDLMSRGELIEPGLVENILAAPLLFYISRKSDGTVIDLHFRLID